MTREQIKVVIAKMASVRADCSSEAESDARRGDFTSANLNLVKSYTMRDAANMLRDALAESESADGGDFFCLVCSARGFSPECVKHAERCPCKVTP